MAKAEEVLKKYFGYDSFRNGQKEIINNILDNRDCLAIMPTGAGKSICYQIPAIMFDGVTIVISPLISLMKDQVDTLNELGIPTTFINSSMSYTEYNQTIENIVHNIYKIIYVAPERLNSETFVRLLNKIKVSMFAIDEAHCVSQWGHDFRPSYTEIANVILNLHNRPIVTAFTATATKIVKDDIINLLHLNDPFIMSTKLDRPNLQFCVETNSNKMEYILKFIDEHQNESGIIYCLTRNNVDSIFNYLNKKGYKVSKYHAGMNEKERTQSQEDFIYDRTNVIVATNAFGMGIDKSNIRYVIHYNMPHDLESYYQEAGRAGRDGDKAECVLLFSRGDIVTNKLLIEQTGINENKIAYSKLKAIVDYCNTDKCLRKYILEYFGEKTELENCNNCSNCLSQIEVTDITIDSKKILSCIKRMNQRWGVGIVTDVLKGSKSSKLYDLGFDKLSTYGIMSQYTKDTIKDLIYFLITEGYINSVGDKFPILVLTKPAEDVLFKNKEVYIKKTILKKVEKEDVNYDEKLFEELRKIRKEMSIKYNIPPFIIFADTSLKQMSTYYPVTVENMLRISGVGANKMGKYGEIFIQAIKNYVIENNIEPMDIKSLEKEDKKEIKISKKEDTKIISYNLYKEGKTIAQIADIREFTKETIGKHLINCLKDGLDINLEKEVNKKYESEILNTINKLGYEKLRPLKDALPSEVSYFDIQYYIAINKK